MPSPTSLYISFRTISSTIQYGASLLFKFLFSSRKIYSNTPFGVYNKPHYGIPSMLSLSSVIVYFSTHYGSHSHYRIFPLLFLLSALIHARVTSFANTHYEGNPHCSLFLLSLASMYPTFTSIYPTIACSLYSPLPVTFFLSLLVSTTPVASSTTTHYGGGARCKQFPLSLASLYPPLISMYSAATRPQYSPLPLLLLLSLLVSTTPVASSTTTRCGGHLTRPRGVLHTPDFPFPYPLPLHCEWVIEAPPGGRVAVYFTQFYLKTGLSAAEYDYYHSVDELHRHSSVGVGRHDFGVIGAADEPTYLVSDRRVLVLAMRVTHDADVHLRVREHLLDVAGFNVTYEVVASGAGVREDACIYHHCSFTGVCLASADFGRYKCDCFEGYFGEECQYDAACGPDSAVEVCQNGGTCRYYIGSSVRTCECLPGYIGAKCENAIPSDFYEIISNNSELECKNSQHPPTQGYISVYNKGRRCDHKTLIQRLEISEPMPVPEGAPLMVACVVRVGKGGVTVRWLRDGHPIALHASKGRLWSMQVPRDSLGRSTFLLGFDSTAQLDSGVITCSARDEDRRNDSLSVQVSVLPRSTLLVEPLSTTVVVGGTAKITCVAKEGLAANSRYSWKRDGGDVQRWRGRERVEDLYPVGTRLILRDVRRSANYTCVMRTPSFTACHAVAVTVLNQTDFLSKTCPQEKSYGVRWKVTAVDSVDVHKCPSGYTGYMRRRCKILPGQHIGWEEPDFSTCLSPVMLNLKKEFDSRRLGYRRKTLNALLRELSEFLGSRYAEMQPSEAEPAVEMLTGVDPGSLLEEDAQSNWNLTLSVASVLFHPNIVKKHHDRVKLLLFVQNVTLTYGEMNEDHWSRRFQSRCLSVGVFKLFWRNSQSAQLPWCETPEQKSYCGVISLKVGQDDWLQSNSQDNISLVVSTFLYTCLQLSGLSNTFTRF